MEIEANLTYFKKKRQKSDPFYKRRVVFLPIYFIFHQQTMTATKLSQFLVRAYFISYNETKGSKEIQHRVHQFMLKANELMEEDHGETLNMHSWSHTRVEVIEGEIIEVSEFIVEVNSAVLVLLTENLAISQDHFLSLIQEKGLFGFSKGLVLSMSEKNKVVNFRI